MRIDGAAAIDYGSEVRSVLAAAVVLCAAPAAAHHVVSEYGTAPVGPLTYVELDVQAAHFDLGSSVGTWQAASLFVEVSPAAWWSLSARLGVAHIDIDHAGTETGLLDADVAGKLRLYESPDERIVVAAGLAVGLPTGSEDKRIGAGHTELSPFVATSLRPHRAVVVNVVVADHVSLGGDHEHHDHEHAPGEGHGSVVAPHGEHELITRAVATLLAAPFSFGAGVEWIQVFDGEETGAVVSARGEVGFDLDGKMRLLVAGDAPLAGEDRYSWRLRTALARRF